MKNVDISMCKLTVVPEGLIFRHRHVKLLVCLEGSCILLKMIGIFSITKTQHRIAARDMISGLPFLLNARTQPDRLRE